VLALAIGLLTGAAAAGADVSFGDMIGAGANCLPIALLFLSLGTLASGSTRPSWRIGATGAG
jgi:hypothetical protein